MSAFLTLDGVALRTPEGQTLFDDLNVSLGAERIGLVGRNGSGKSSLLRVAAGLAEPSAGSVRRSGTVGLLRQDWPENWTLADALGVSEPLAVLGRILTGQGSAEDLEAADWTLEPRLEAALAEAGLPGWPFDRRVGTLSGGERTRVGIARLLVEAPDLILLDEPTNNLDRPGRDTIWALLRDWRGGVLVASHDRALLEHVDRIVELTPLGVRIVGGGWSALAAWREAERARAAAALERAGAQLRDARAAAQQEREAKARRDRAGRAFAAKGSAPKILLGAQAERAENTGSRARAVGERLIGEAAARAEAARARVEVLAPLTIILPSSGLPSGAELLALDDVVADPGGGPLGPWTLAITGPERVAIGGPNGAGKTTLLKVAAGALRPVAGRVRRAEGRIALLDQHVGLLDPAASILANVRRLNPSLGEREAYAVCARFAFRNREAERRVETLSGGERLRAGLAGLLGRPQAPWLLILDEPTNHLDIESVALLEQALRGYDGALLVVSHDPAFLEAVGIERNVEIEARNCV
ncbi:ABC-F family ATP-binding cassette domain-containing protein [Methylobacterium pseudosasicola]|uniref:ATPase components of ABC transporters with duplicated ATPase domains n=1 Tax=Methylobacterium pseudosasicola TaxID=582667 RepID=A0A1I4V1C3_9HYPH|nr:ABC-F family ATP-binding cassette domain-containing protein [Methylobacterium pseudosasicola]SFM94800.1 ATPase components of ABC transporters with duplicated ATPase domains [Methylobacterium pseudosasicola]